MDFLLGNWAELLLAVMLLAKTIVRLTPGVKDDAVFAYIDRLVEAVLPENE